MNLIVYLIAISIPCVILYGVIYFAVKNAIIHAHSTIEQGKQNHE